MDRHSLPFGRLGSLPEAANASACPSSLPYPGESSEVSSVVCARIVVQGTCEPSYRARQGVRLKRNPAPWPSSADASGRSKAELGSSLSEMNEPSVANSEEGRLSEFLDDLLPIEPAATPIEGM